MFLIKPPFFRRCSKAPFKVYGQSKEDQICSEGCSQIEQAGAKLYLV
jgi:hypothetical protein